MNVVLIEPEIPQNTGNIARTCACTGATLHLVEPMGFRLTQRNLARAGCDYWDEVEIVRWSCAGEFLEAHGRDELHLFTGTTAPIPTCCSAVRARVSTRRFSTASPSSASAYPCAKACARSTSRTLSQSPYTNACAKRVSQSLPRNIVGVSSVAPPCSRVIFRMLDCAAVGSHAFDTIPC